MGITEPHLDDSINCAKLFPQQYIISRYDRNRRGRGILIVVKSNIIYNRHNDLEEESTELLAMDIHYSKNRYFVFCIFYRPPDCGAGPLRVLGEKLSVLSDTLEVIFTGDFNLKDVDWKRNEILNHTEPYEVLSDIIFDNFFTQVVDQPTRGDNIRDLV